MKTLEELTDEFNMAQRMVLDKTIEITLLREGIDPEKVSMKDFDHIRRLSTEIDRINDRTEEKTVKIREEANTEINSIVTELENLSTEIKAKLTAETDALSGEAAKDDGNS